MNSTLNESSAETRQRLLEAAGRLFAEHGFARTTIRDICTRAEANIAAVNYHFGGKEGLYRAVLNHWVTEAFAKYPPTMDLPDHPTAKQRLRAFIRSLLFRVLDTGRPAWHGKLMAREMSDPTPLLDELVEQLFRPQLQALCGIIRELTGPGPADSDLWRCAHSVAGQCLFHQMAHPVLMRLDPHLNHTTEDIERLAEHITCMSLAGIKAIAAGRKAGRL